MILFFLIAPLTWQVDSLAESQSPTPQEVPTEDRSSAQDWWASLSEEARGKMRQRHKRFRAMSPEAQEELRRRASLYSKSWEHEKQLLSEEEREKFNSLSQKERYRFLGERIRGRYSRHSDDLKRRLDWPAQFQGRTFGDRYRESRRLIEEHRAEELDRQLIALTTEGWVGSQALDEARSLPLHARAALAATGRMWKEFQGLRLSGALERSGLQPEMLVHILSLPSRESLRVFIMLKDGRSLEEATRFISPLSGEKERRGRSHGQRGRMRSQGDHPRGRVEGPRAPGEGRQNKGNRTPRR